MTRKRKAVNEEFFNDLESKIVWYTIGACYYGYAPDHPAQFKFTHTIKKLVKIVRTAIGSSHAIISDNRDRKSYWISIRGAPYLYETLGDLGLNEPKSKRKPPKYLEEPYVSHFTRGLLESRKRIKPRQFGNDEGRLHVHYPPEFLVWFNFLMRVYAGVEQEDPRKDYIIYNQEDTVRIHSLCYITDWEYTQEHGIYLPSNKRLVQPAPKPRTPLPSIMERKLKVAFAMKYIDDYSLAEMSQMLGYTDPNNSLSIAFKETTGLTLRELRELEPKERKLLIS